MRPVLLCFRCFSGGDAVFISELQAGPLNTFYMLLSSACWDFWEVAIFCRNQKSGIDCTNPRVQLPEWSMDVIWRLENWTKALWSGNLRRQQLWHGSLHCRWKERGGRLFFFLLSVCLHCAFYSKQCLTEPRFLFEMQVIQDSIKLEFKKKKKVYFN